MMFPEGLSTPLVLPSALRMIVQSPGLSVPFKSYKVNFKLLTVRKRSNPLTHLPIFSILCPLYPPKSLECLHHAHTTCPQYVYMSHTIHHIPPRTMSHTHQTTRMSHHIYTHRNWVCCYISTKLPPSLYLSFCCLSALELGFFSLFQD